ncbi:MAG: hypothetical protein J6D28_05635 [Bacilli bacterium]|nr:hypothetical protein [Bacilli bacterium]
MKKILIPLTIILLTACSMLDISNTPTKKAEEFLNKYQILHEDVIKDLDNVLKKEQFSINNQEEYRELIKKQYKDLQYEIKETKEDGNEATITAEIIVKDYTKTIKEAEIYKRTHIKEFYEEETYSDDKYKKYLIERLKEAKDKVTYQINLTAHKENGKWQLDKITEEVEDKILGIYDYGD